MKSIIIKVSKYSFFHYFFIILLTAIPVISSAQKIVDTSSPEDPLISPTIVVRSATIKPDCHTYTGCGAIVERYHKYKYHYRKYKRHCGYHRYRAATCGYFPSGI